ncbi:hypothetical protein PR202_gb01141 [Eleusine coracana subsp. coracana]|uniref:Uncharacterized protein n=1 Tax=Eleusine coracana subsp. coracana TaxID=191504 RepID=A0AAV5DVC2_ELECO|nr:hypothetical protein PR202_gb01141 [Eleusine coracana subsp. coracana]
MTPVTLSRRSVAPGSHVSPMWSKLFHRMFEALVDEASTRLPVSRRTATAVTFPPSRFFRPRDRVQRGRPVTGSVHIGEAANLLVLVQRGVGLKSW